MSVLRDDLVYVEDHADAMIAATTAHGRARVLASALAHHFGGVRLDCTRHGGTFTFAELRGHLTDPRFPLHGAGDVVPADPDPRELGRTGQTAADL